MKNDRRAGGLRRSPFKTLTECEIEHLKNEIRAIEADENVFVFNYSVSTSYDERKDIIAVRGNVFPDKNSIHPRDLMSERAVLAHEYYGHYKYAPSNFVLGDWRDEFRASYMAAKNAPNLTDEDRQYLILDAIERTKEAGISLKYNDFMRRILYGY